MSLLRLLGIDNLRDEYAYTFDPVLGYTSAQRTAEEWVKSTCGYCSVGCGMEIGVRDGKAVAVRGWDDHPVNLGKLCPKGSQRASTRSTLPIARVTRCCARIGRLSRVSWDKRSKRWRRGSALPRRSYGPQSVGVI